MRKNNEQTGWSKTPFRWNRGVKDIDPEAEHAHTVLRAAPSYGRVICESWGGRVSEAIRFFSKFSGLILIKEVASNAFVEGEAIIAVRFKGLR